MDKEFANKLGIFVHVYDHLNGGCFAAHHQLRFYNEEIYNLYLEDRREDLIKIYEELKKEIPQGILKVVENSSGIRYFLCDDCHDAQVINIWSEGDLLFLELETSGMIGCLNISGNKCVIKIKTFDSKECEKLINDFFINDRAYWFSSNILLENDCVYCNLILKMFYKNNYENYNYKFNIEDIYVEEKN